MAAIRSKSLFLLALFALAACREAEPEPDGFDPAALALPPPTEGACRRQTFEGTEFTVCPFDTRADQIEIAWRGADGMPLRSLPALRRELGPRAAEIRFAVNGGMYDEQGAPIGLLIADGEQLKSLNRKSGPGNFHLMPNGVFAVDDQGGISVTPSHAFRARGIAWATQSGPMLVIDGRLHPKFDADGPSQLIRNGVGAIDGRRGVIAISEQGVSFGRFARLFRDALGCRNALYLDGSVSSLWDPGAGREDGYDQLGPLIVVSRGAPSGSD